MNQPLYQDLFDLETSHWWHIAKRKTVISLIKKFHAGKDLKILDLGCGTGMNLKALSLFGQTWGVDSSEEAIRFCSKRGLKNVYQASSDRTRFHDNAFNVITLLDVLEHVEETSTLKEIQRLLKPDGIVIITVPAYQWLWSKWDEILHHKRRYNQSTLIKALKMEDFQIKKISYLYSFLLLPVALIRPLKMFFSKDSYQSDFRLSNSLSNLFLTKLADAERSIMLKYFVPFGTSIICVASKK